ncbi:hypothetical protein ACJX0J_028071, partial [Zea mays]
FSESETNIFGDPLALPATLLVNIDSLPATLLVNIDSLKHVIEFSTHSTSAHILIKILSNIVLVETALSENAGEDMT